MSNHSLTQETIEILNQIRCAVGAAPLNHNVVYYLISEGINQIFTIGVEKRLQASLFEMKNNINDPFEPKPTMESVLELLDEIEQTITKAA